MNDKWIKIEDIALQVFAVVFILAIIFYPSAKNQPASILQTVNPEGGEQQTVETPILTPETTPAPTPGPTAVFKDKINRLLFKYYPLSVGTKWVYKDWTYRFKEFEGESLLVKEVSELTVTVSKIYEEQGKEYVELDRVDKIIDRLEVNESDDTTNPEIKTYRKISFPKDEQLVFNTTQVLEVSGLTVKYIYPNYPEYIDVFPLREGVLIDYNESQSDRYESAYGEEARVWRRAKADNYNINNKEYKNCYKSIIYDLRGTSGSKNEIIFCEGLGPVKSVSELIRYSHHSYYYDLIDFEAK